jgi:hypothetical protein
MTLTAAPIAAAHPRIIYPGSARRVFPFTAAAAEGGVFIPPIHNINQAVNRAATY